MTRRGATGPRCGVGPRLRWITVTLLTCLGVSVTLAAQRPPSGAKPAAQPDADLTAAAQYVRDVVAGTAVAPDATLTWQPYFVKSQGDQVYVPFTVMLEPGSLAARQVALYYDVVRKGPQMVAFEVKPDEKDGSLVVIAGEIVNTSAAAASNVKVSATALDRTGKILATQSAVVAEVAAGQKAPFQVSMKAPQNADRYNAVIDGAPQAFREFAVVDLPSAPAGQAVRVSRAFAAAAGDYDVYVVMRERPGQAQQATGPKVALLKEQIAVPDLGTGLAVSSIFLAERVESLAAPPGRDEQLNQPFTFGTMAVVPATSPARPKAGELSVIFFVYNTGVDASNRPNVTVEYSFHQGTGAGAKFFNKTAPQQFDAETLPPGFDLSQGHQIVAGQSVPLASFPAAEYRLEVKVTDKISGQSLTRDVPFAVTE